MKISEILTKHGTDKTFNNRNGHCYGETYDNLFEKYKRDSKISILKSVYTTAIVWVPGKNHFLTRLYVE